MSKYFLQKTEDGMRKRRHVKVKRKQISRLAEENTLILLPVELVKLIDAYVWSRCVCCLMPISPHQLLGWNCSFEDSKTFSLASNPCEPGNVFGDDLHFKTEECLINKVVSVNTHDEAQSLIMHMQTFRIDGNRLKWSLSVVASQQNAIVDESPLMHPLSKILDLDAKPNEPSSWSSITSYNPGVMENLRMIGMTDDELEHLWQSKAEASEYSKSFSLRRAGLIACIRAQLVANLEALTSP
jgi:hypothetical protein